jgi:hypothetical protein
MTQDLISQREQVLKGIVAAAALNTEMTSHEKQMVALDAAKFLELKDNGLVMVENGNIVMNLVECGDEYVNNVCARARLLENEYNLAA